MWETRVWSLSQEDPPEEGMATHSSIPAWRVLWTEEPGGYSPWCCQELDMTEWLTLISKETFHPNILDQGNWNSWFNWNWCNQNLPTFFLSGMKHHTRHHRGYASIRSLSLWTTALTGERQMGEKNKFTVISGAQQNILCAMSKVQMITGSKRGRNCIYLQKVRLTLHGISDEPCQGENSDRTQLSFYSNIYWAGLLCQPQFWVRCTQ